MLGLTLHDPRTGAADDFIPAQVLPGRLTGETTEALLEMPLRQEAVGALALIDGQAQSDSAARLLVLDGTPASRAIAVQGGIS